MKKAVKKTAKKSKARTREEWVAVSGGFDPLHIGHVRMMQKAKSLGDKLVVILNNDNWLYLKKGFVFMPEAERKEMIEALPFVDRVVVTDHKKNDTDMSVSRMLAKVKPAIFANGGDRTKTTTPEDSVCEELGIRRAYGIGAGGKVQSSSWMVQAAVKSVFRSVRPWGEFYGWNKGTGWYLKTIHIVPGKRLSLQYHNNRSEYWMLVEGDATATIRNGAGKDERVPLKQGGIISVPQNVVHRLESKKGGTIVEIALGEFDENDIVRLDDDHGRV